jgi:hypothetical protein
VCIVIDGRISKLSIVSVAGRTIVGRTILIKASDRLKTHAPEKSTASDDKTDSRSNFRLLQQPATVTQSALNGVLRLRPTAVRYARLQCQFVLPAL